MRCGTRTPRTPAGRPAGKWLPKENATAVGQAEGAALDCMSRGCADEGAHPMTRAQLHIFPVSAREGIPQYGLDLGPARLLCTEGATSVYTCACDGAASRELARRKAFADGVGGHADPNTQPIQGLGRVGRDRERERERELGKRR